METKVSSATREIIIGDDRPTVLIGERINPSGKKKLAEALRTGNLKIIRKMALEQVQAGADILDVNVSTTGVDDVALLPQAVKMVMDTVDVPLCLDNANPQALAAALKVYKGKPIINSVTGQERSLDSILPLVKEYDTAVIGLLQDDGGIPCNPEERVAIAHKLLERAATLGIPSKNIIIDCLVLTVASDAGAGLVTLETIHRLKDELGINMTLGTSNISFGLPDRELVTNVFLAIAIAAGVTCPIVDVAKVRPTVPATDLILGRDEFAGRYLKAYRERKTSLGRDSAPKLREAKV